MILPLRDPIMLARQVSTLDEYSQARIILAVGLGSYREEFSAMSPQLSSHSRGDLMIDALKALRLLFSESCASFHGKFTSFEEVALNPKPKLLYCMTNLFCNALVKFGEGAVEAVQGAMHELAWKTSHATQQIEAEPLSALLRRERSSGSRAGGRLWEWVAHGNSQPREASARNKLPPNISQKVRT